jgi:hypothetical protein
LLILIQAGRGAVYPQIYLGSTPPTVPERRALRSLAAALRSGIDVARVPEPTVLLLRFSADNRTPAEPIDLLLLRSNAVIVGAVRAYPGAIEALPSGRWTYRDTGEPIHDQRGRTPLQHVKAQRDLVRDRLEQAAADLPAVGPDEHPFERTIGALICAPRTHPDSRISLDVGDHRALLKVLGLDELPALAGMVHTSARLSPEAIGAIATEVFDGRLWHDGERFLFDLAPARFQLRLLTSAEHSQTVLPLMEGENIVGRRRLAKGDEHRLMLSGDDLMSSDHAQITCTDDDRVVLRDMSKNGTWITSAGAAEERVRGERVIVPGELLRMGFTRLRLERAGEQ